MQTPQLIVRLLTASKRLLTIGLRLVEPNAHAKCLSRLSNEKMRDFTKKLTGCHKTLEAFKGNAKNISEEALMELENTLSEIEDTLNSAMN